jgi:exonuclease III
VVQVPIISGDAKQAEENYTILPKKRSMSNLSELSCKVIVWNVWSILNEVKLNQFLQIIEDKKIHVACITETWFDSRNGKFTATVKEAGFGIVHSFRENKRGGGTALIYKKELKVKEGDESSSKYESFEFSSIYLKHEYNNILILCIYRKQEVPCKTFCCELESYLDEISDKTEELIIVGDFNIWTDVQGNKDAKKLSTLMSAYGLTQLITESTHRGGHTLDHVYINQQTTNLEHEVLQDTFGLTTDHYPSVLK